MNRTSQSFISCGMYAFTGELKLAWRQLLEHYLDLSIAAGGPRVLLNFDSDPSLLDDPGLFFGHTCGYPLMTRLKDRLTPFCVPVFDVPGADGKFYSSRFIVSANSDIGSVSESKGKIAAVNNPDSNSGMNVFRYAIAGYKPGGPFFSSIVETGGHLHSVEAVALGTADIAAIDCVSYQLIVDHWPELTDQVRGIGFSEQTCGLPLVIPTSRIELVDIDLMIKQLKQSLAIMPESDRELLHLRGFEAVGFGDYARIVDLETLAKESGYPELV